ncbi:hypothetical protein BDQ17DRAFT_1372778 [Cyathus striatus]|nr:hypothetical protein BDQ17DRAFT_1372778 [Cyathus striatus]
MRAKTRKRGFIVIVCFLCGAMKGVRILRGDKRRTTHLSNISPSRDGGQKRRDTKIQNAGGSPYKRTPKHPICKSTFPEKKQYYRP